jgi:hypothetical protein
VKRGSGAMQAGSRAADGRTNSGPSRDPALAWTIVVPTRRRAAALARLIHSLQHQRERNFEVIVVADGPDVATRGLAGRLRPKFELRWIFSPRSQGPAAARNAGAAEARGRRVLFLDDDVTVPQPAPRPRPRPRERTPDGGCGADR